MFGAEAMSVREYAPGKLRNGDVLSDFAEQIGINVDEQSAERVNVSATLRTSALLSVYWKNPGPRYGPGVENMISNALNVELAALGSEKLVIHHDILGPLMEQMKPHLTWLHQNFGIEFDSKVPESSEGLQSLDELTPIARAQETGLYEIVCNALQEIENLDPERSLLARLNTIRPQQEQDTRLAGMIGILREVQYLKLKDNQLESLR